MKTTAELIGINQVHTVLDKLPKRLNRKLLNSALSKALNLYIKEVRNRGKQISKKMGSASSFGKLTKKELPQGARLNIPFAVAGVRKKKGGFGFLYLIYEYGAYKHPVIKPKKGKFLKFEKDGKTIFAKQVRGVKARPILRPSADIARPRVEKEFENILHKVVIKFLDKEVIKRDIKW